jgi:hypothetical protein
VVGVSGVGYGGEEERAEENQRCEQHKLPEHRYGRLL